MQQAMLNEHTELLVKALMTVETREECLALLSDLCTIKEVQDLAQRVEVARLLRARTTYTEIAQLTGVSTATISRVNRSLTYGANGYKTALERLEAMDD